MFFGRKSKQIGDWLLIRRRPQKYGLASQQQPLSASNPDESHSQQFLELLIFFH
jgi:hypothetical protein